MEEEPDEPDYIGEPFVRNGDDGIRELMVDWTEPPEPGVILGPDGNPLVIVDMSEPVGFARVL